jgi:two-component system chemotaxis response regulator CheY
MKCLVVDDEFVALTTLTTLLADVAQCDAATHGQQAIQMFSSAIIRRAPYDLITIDIQMPDMDGFALLKRLREEELLHNATPAKKIMVTASSSAHNVNKAVTNRCDQFLVKPVSKKLLFRKLADLGLIVPSMLGVAKAETEENAPVDTATTTS